MTAIEWADVVWNPVRGCSRVSKGCEHCYAERFAMRMSGPGQPYEGLVERGPNGPRWTGRVVCDERKLVEPLHWCKPKRVFVNSMGDLFHESVSVDFLDRAFNSMIRAERHQFLILTKRPERMRAYMACHIPPGGALIPNVWLGVSVEDQATADDRVPILLKTPAAIRWVSYEPALGPVYFQPWLHTAGHSVLAADALHWVVMGGESGPGARPMHPDWARYVRYQCADTGVPFFFKQWGENFPRSCWEDNPELVLPDDCDCPEPEPGHDGEIYHAVGKRRAGRVLDGRVHDAYPAAKT